MFEAKATAPSGILRKIWRELRALRKDGRQSTGRMVKALKTARVATRSGSGGLLRGLAGRGGALLSMVGRMLGGAGALTARAAPALLALPALKLLKPESGARALKSSAPGLEGVLTNAAHAAGADANLVMAIARYESRMDPTARPTRKDGTPISSAHGLGQFTDDTWLDAIRRFGQKSGVGRGASTTMAEAQALRDDPALQARMLAEWTAKNSGQARRAFGANDPAAVYAMHVLGEGDGPKFLRALRADIDGNTSTGIRSVLPPAVIANNPSLFGGATLSDAFAKLGRAVAGASRDVGAPRLPVAASVLRPHTAVTVPPPVQVPRVRPPPPPTVPAAPPAVELGELSRVNAPTPAGPIKLSMPQRLGQDVRDRRVAAIATGGIGQSWLT